MVVSVSISIAAEDTAEAIIQSIDKLVSELAEKITEHVAVAKYYREKAIEAKNEAEHHLKLKKFIQQLGTQRHKVLGAHLLALYKMTWLC